MSQTANTEDTIDLKELFFSLIAQWKMITLCVLLSIVCALLYLRTTPDTYAVDALVQVEDSKGASAALLGDLSSMIEQKSPAQAEIEILKSRLVLGSVIDHLNLNIRVSGTEDSFWNRLIAKHEYDSEYSSQSVLFKDNQKSFDIRQFDIPQYFQDKNLILKFAQGKYSLTDAATGQVVFSAPLNQVSQLQSEFGLWKVAIFSQDSFNAAYNIRKQSLPAAMKSLTANYSVAEKGKLTGVLGLNYQGSDKQHITQVLNAILAAYSQQNIERRSAETAQTLKDQLIDNGFELVNTTQGYTNCSIAVIDENSAIVTDKGLNKILQKHGIKTLYLDEKLDIKLLNENEYSEKTGFIGGCISRIKNKIIVFGDLDKIDFQNKIRSFIHERNLEVIEFKGLDVIDYGGLIEVG